MIGRTTSLSTKEALNETRFDDVRQQADAVCPLKSTRDACTLVEGEMSKWRNSLEALHSVRSEDVVQKPEEIRNQPAAKLKVDLDAYQDSKSKAQAQAGNIGQRIVSGFFDVAKCAYHWFGSAKEQEKPADQPMIDPLLSSLTVDDFTFLDASEEEKAKEGESLGASLTKSFLKVGSPATSSIFAGRRVDVSCHGNDLVNGEKPASSPQ